MLKPLTKRKLIEIREWKMLSSSKLQELSEKKSEKKFSKRKILRKPSRLASRELASHVLDRMGTKIKTKLIQRIKSNSNRSRAKTQEIIIKLKLEVMPRTIITHRQIRLKSKVIL